MKKGIIYKVTNKINGKIYIGQTIHSLNKRKNEHRYQSRNTKRTDYHKHFYNAIRKYGFDNFEWEILFENIEEKYLDEYEIWAINFYNTYKYGYNCTLGGNVGRGYKFSLESRQKMSKLAQKRMQDPVYVKKISKGWFSAGESFTPWNKGKKIGPMSEEKREKISKGHNAKEFAALKDKKIIGIWINQSKCARDLNLIRQDVNLCLSKKAKSHKGYKFIYLKELGIL